MNSYLALVADISERRFAANFGTFLLPALLVSFSRAGVSEEVREVDSKVIQIKGSIVKITAGREELNIDLAGAEFNGDRRGLRTQATAPI